MENKWIETESGEKWRTTKKNGVQREMENKQTETEYGEKWGITERNGVAGNGSEGWDGDCEVNGVDGEHDRMW